MRNRLSRILSGQATRLSAGPLGKVMGGPVPGMAFGSGLDLDDLDPAAVL